MTQQAGLAVLDDHQGLRVVLPLLRRQILDQLHLEPASSTGLSRKLGLPRQKVNYHVRLLEKAGLLEVASEKKRRGCTERLFRPAARTYLVNPDILGGLAVDPETVRDRFSSSYLLRLAARVVKDVAHLRRGAQEARKRLATFALEVDVSFRTPADRTAFTEELTAAVAELVQRYQDNSAGSRPYRFVIGGHVAAKTSNSKGDSDHDDRKQ